MIINKEFFFRGWLPAGLVINARLMLASPSEGIATLKPVINPRPGFGWPTYQPAPSFPIEQANDVNAIVLKDAFPDGTIVALPSGEWFGSGTPYVLAVNTWYEGRIQSVSGGDVMAIRLLLNDSKSYYWTTGYPDPRVDPDICVSNMACKFIPGKTTQRALFLDSGSAMLNEAGYPAMVSVRVGPSADPTPSPALLADVIRLSAYHTYGMASGLTEDQTPDSLVYFLQCEIADGKVTGTPLNKYAMYGIAPVSVNQVQAFYLASDGQISDTMDDMNVLSKVTWPMRIVVASDSGDDQLVHYN